MSQRMLKRINIELDVVRKIYNVGVIKFITNESRTQTIIELEFTEFNIRFSFPQDYPFKPFNIEINDFDYINLLSRYHANNPKFKQINGSCLCCSSIIGHCNWMPVVTMSTMVVEIVNNLHYITKSLEYMKHQVVKLQDESNVLISNK